MESERQHWESIYRTKSEDELSWHQAEPTLSLRLIRAVAKPGSRIIDVGGGTSTLAARLVEAGFRKVTVLDIAETALRSSRTRSGSRAARVRWRRADILRPGRLGRFDIWHDRAVFHFLTGSRERQAYVALAERTVPLGGHVILATFAEDGPTACSGLEVSRYAGRQLGEVFSKGFELLQTLREVHETPWGTRQSFTYVDLRRIRRGIPVRRAVRRAKDGSSAAGVGDTR